MFCLSINKPIVANATIPQNTNPEENKPSLASTKTTSSSSSSPPNNLRRRSPQPSVLQIERIVGAGSFRDGEPQPRDSDMRKTVLDLFLGEAFEGSVQKKLRETGEWLVENSETRFHSSRKGILIFAFQWMIPIWAILLLIASGTIKLPFSSPFLDDLLL